MGEKKDIFVTLYNNSKDPNKEEGGGLQVLASEM